MEEIGKAKDEGAPPPSGDDWRTLTVNRGTRGGTLIFTFYTLLQSIVDGWRRNHLADENVNSLLASDHVRVLADFRNALLHPIGAAEERYTRMASVHGELAPWAFDLMRAFNGYFIAWFRSFDTVQRTGLRPSNPSDT
jgi:hypothetical protein